MELRRAVAMGPAALANGQGPSAITKSSSPGEMVLWDGVGFSDADVAELSDRLGVKIRSADDDGLELMGVQPSGENSGKAGGPTVAEAFSSAQRAAPAVALAMVGARRHLLPLNFADSRLAVKPPPRIGRLTLWAGAIGAAVIMFVIALYVHVTLLGSKLEDLQAQRASIKEPVAVAQGVSDRVTFAGGFFDSRTPMLQCLRDISQALRPNEQLWAMSFNITEDRESKSMGRAKGRLDGKTTNRDIALELADRLRENPRFSNVQGPDVTVGGGRDRELSAFSISFSYTADSTPALDTTSAAGASTGTTPATQPLRDRDRDRERERSGDESRTQLETPAPTTAPVPAVVAAAPMSIEPAPPATAPTTQDARQQQ
jgi:hypothetical protein